MVYHKRKFTEVDGAILLENTEKFGHALREAQSNAPFNWDTWWLPCWAASRNSSCETPPV